MSEREPSDTRVKAPETTPADEFAMSRFRKISEFHFSAPAETDRLEPALFTLCWALVGAFILLAGFVIETDGSLIKTFGISLLLLSLPVLALERLFLRLKIQVKMRGLHPLVDELREMRLAVAKYLTDLDRRTSRYFHCVTNSKVTTYFMLRQIENSLGRLIEKLDGLCARAQPADLEKFQQLLRGTLEYRDGFEFNSGALLYVPIYQLSIRIQELVADLERGISALEDEIDHYRLEVVGTHHREPERQIELPLTPPEE